MCYKLFTGGTPDDHIAGRRSEPGMRAKNSYLWAAAAGAVSVFALVAGGAAATGTVDPSFVSGPGFDAGYAPTGAAAADFNRDGTPDLAVANCLDDYSSGEEEKRSEEHTSEPQ